MIKWLLSQIKTEMPEKLFPSHYKNKTEEEKLNEDFLPHYVHVETKERADIILSLNPKGSLMKRSDFLIQEIILDRYLSRIIMGEPESFLYSELALPLIRRCKGALIREQALKRLEGFHYVVPSAFVVVI